MWISVNLGYEYIVVRHIPIVLENKVAGKALKFPVPKTMNVRFRGYGWLLAGLYLSTDVKYVIDVSSLNADYLIITNRDLPEHIKLPVAVQPIDAKPETLILALDDYGEKRIPIIPRLALSYREGYGQVGSVRVLPESVLLGGARSIVDHIKQWQTVYRKYDNLRTSIDAEIPLEMPTSYSVELAQQSTHVQINIQPFAEKIVSGISVRARTSPPNREIVFIPPKIDLTVRGGIDQLAKLSDADIEVLVEYQSLLKDTSGITVPSVTVPEGMKVVGRNPERFQFIIRKKL